MKKARLFPVFPWLAGLATMALTAAPGYSQAAQNSSPPSTASKPAQASAASDPAPKPSVPDDKVVIKVDDRKVTAADVDYLVHSMPEQDQQTVAAQGKGPIASQYIQMLVLEQQALRDHLDSNPDLERQVSFDRARWLARAEFQKLSGETKVTPDEINQYYSAHATDFDQVQLRQVGIRVKPANAAASTPGLTAEEARARAEEIRKALSAGTDPQEVAKKFAVPNVVVIDPKGQNYGRDKLPANLADAILKLKDGEMTGTQETPQSVFFVQMIKHFHPEVKDVSVSIEEQIRQQKILSTIGQLQKKASVWSDQEYFKPPAASTGSPAPSLSPGSGGSSSTKPPASKPEAPAPPPK